MTEYTGFDLSLFERSETRKYTNIDYIRSLSVKELAEEIKKFIYLCEEGECPFDNDYYGSTLNAITEWLVSERSEKEKNL